MKPLRHAKSVALVAVLALSGCSGCSKTADTADNTVAPPDTANIAAPAVAAPVAPSMEVSSGSNYVNGGFVTVKNTDSSVFQLNKIVVNNQNGDLGCDLKVFKQIGPGTSTVIPVPHCGNILSVEVDTDRGSKTTTFSTISVKIDSDSDNNTTLTISNNGASPINVQKFIVNDQAADENCNIKVFKSVAADSSLTVPVTQCGTISKVVVTADNSEYTVNFQTNNQP